MTDAPIIDVQSLQKTYRDGLIRPRRVEALRGVSLEVQPGEIFGLLGPNGAGKTTLIKILLGIVHKTGGEAHILGRHAGDRTARRQVGYLPESHRIPRHLTGDSALEYYGGLSNMTTSQIRKRRPALLETVGLAKWGRTSVKKYSKGMLQRLGLAQAMLHDPRLLILDEPTDGVDPVGRREIRDILKQLKTEGKTVFLNSHLLQELELVCDRVAILVEGRMRRIGGVAEITDRVGGDGGDGAGIELVLQLEGEEAAIRKAFGDRRPTSWKPAGSNRFHAGVPVSDQGQVDEVVDALRKGGVSIYSMTRHKMTLEDAFIDIVQEKHPEP